MNLPPQANLQRRIVVALAREPAATSSQLADRLGAYRPSVCRALGPLVAMGAIHRSGHELWLTQTGREMALGCANDLAAKEGKARSRLDKVSREHRRLSRYLGTLAVPPPLRPPRPAFVPR